ncbi:MBL fold metallo-hydrolase [Planctobacterium marinum]|uniref:Zn-dependent hydrolase n=1 Tax=Planctobacterium marinum TaxID=1631968 RepID=A0AA48HKN1_9ALTE|nr:Zn-dependent hydrolase [Planctobacterium marinum]
MKLHRIEGYIQDIWLVEESWGLMLLDGASRADVGTICDFINKQLHRPLNDLKIVVVTHMHPDHAGGARALRQVCKAQIVSANVPGQWYRGIDGLLMHLTDILLAHWVAGRMRKRRRLIWYSPYITPDIALNDGDSIPGFEQWKVLFTQGHTDRDLTLWHQPSNRVYVADLMVKVKQRFIPPYPVFYPNRYKASLQRVRHLSPTSILLAHGGEVRLTAEDFDYLENKAPERPATHWRSVKTKLARIFGLQATSN